MLHLSTLGQAHDTLIQNHPLRLPNGNVIMLPSDLYFFFETEDLSNSSPLFASQVGLIVAQESDISWGDLFKKNTSIYFLRHRQLSEEEPHRLGIHDHFARLEREFILPMIRALDKRDDIRAWPLWNLKSLVLQFFKLLNAMTHRLQEACDRNLANEDPQAFPIEDAEQDTVQSIVLCCFVMSFGACLNADLQRVFEDVFQPFSRRFHYRPNSMSAQRPTIFDVFFDVDNLRWEVIMEKLEYKLRLGFYPKMSALLVPTSSISLSYFLID